MKNLLFLAILLFSCIQYCAQIFKPLIRSAAITQNRRADAIYWYILVRNPYNPDEVHPEDKAFIEWCLNNQSIIPFSVMSQIVDRYSSIDAYRANECKEYEKALIKLCDLLTNRYNNNPLDKSLL